jgi:hypothetical protein
MKFRTSGHHNDSLKLSFKDIILLLCGREIRDGALYVGLWRVPDRFKSCKKEYSIRWIRKAWRKQ